MKQDIKNTVLGLVAGLLVVFTLQWSILGPNANGQVNPLQLGIATRFGQFTNSWWGPAAVSNSLNLLSNQFVHFETNQPYEAIIYPGRGIGLGWSITSTNAKYTNIVYLNFDVSPFGSSLLTSNFAGVSTNPLPFGLSSNYTGTASGVANGSQAITNNTTNFYTIAVQMAGIGTVTGFTNIPGSICENARRIRWTGAYNSCTNCTAGNNTTADNIMISNVLFSVFP